MYKDKDKNKQYQRKWYLANKELQLSRVRTSNKKHGLRWKCEKYGLTVDEYEFIRESQNGKCAICGSDNINAIDHDHETGKVRGLLCTKCNLMLGNARDDTSILVNAIKYLGGSIR